MQTEKEINSKIGSVPLKLVITNPLNMNKTPSGGGALFIDYWARLSPAQGRNFYSMPVELGIHSCCIPCIQNRNPILLAESPRLLTERQGLLKDGNDRFRVIVCRDAINRQSPTFQAFMDQHQLAALIQPILIPAMFHSQPDGFHLSLAGG
jgi:hypothetical protein